MTDAVVGSGRSWAKEITELYKEGASDAEVAAHLNVTIKEYYKQMEENVAFNQLVTMGRTLSLAYWEGLARKHIQNKSFNSSLYAFYMKNKFQWADKTEITSQNENLNTNLDELRQQLSKEVNRFIRTHTPELTDAQHLLTAVVDE